MRTLIAIPCMNQVACEFAHSLGNLRKAGEFVIQENVGSLIYDSRNKLASDAIRFETDYILWLDSDMVFAPDLMERMLEHMKTYDIISGVYYRRVPPFSPVIFKTLKMDEEGNLTEKEDYNDYPKNRVFEVDGIGFGCVMMKTSVVMDVLAKFGNAFAPVGGNGEDIAFCWRAKQLGYKIYADPDIKLGHVGTCVITEEFYNAYK